MRARFGSSLLALLAVLCLGVACSTSGAPSTRTGLQAPEIIVPEDLVDLISTLTLSVYPQASEAGVTLTCDPTTGIVSGNVSSVTPVVVDSSFIKSSSCPGGGSFCTAPGDAGALTIPWTTTPWIFSVLAYDSNTPSVSSEVAVGCTQVNLNTEPTASVTITLLHFVPPSPTCNGSGSISAPQTCNDNGVVCSKTSTPPCSTVEELISFGGDGSGTTYGSPGQMTNPFFLWPSSMDQTAAAFMAFYSDASLTASGGSLQVTARFMGYDLTPPTTFYPVADESSIFLPSSSTVPQPPSSNDEKEPSAAAIGSNVYVAFASDQPVSGAPPTPNPFNIYYVPFGLSSTLSGNGSCLVSTTQSGGIQAYPSIAASGGALYVAWTDNSGNVNGALISSPGTGCTAPATPAVIGSGIPTTGNVGPKVAPTASGWVVVWPSSSGIQMQLISASGAASGTPATVGSGSNPAVASGSSGFAIAWATTSIQVQRYDMNGKAIGAAGPVSNSSENGAVSTPAIAAGTTSAVGEFYAVSWIAGSGSAATVRARYINGTAGTNLSDDSGYLFSPISGQLKDDFPVSLTTTSPANPTVAIGGFNSQYIAFGWEDHGTTCMNPSTFPGTPCYGIIARRFPVPVD
jgi:hypothetical protein